MCRGGLTLGTFSKRNARKFFDIDNISRGEQHIIDAKYLGVTSVSQLPPWYTGSPHLPKFTIYCRWQDAGIRGFSDEEVPRARLRGREKRAETKANGRGSVACRVGVAVRADSQRRMGGGGRAYDTASSLALVIEEKILKY